MDMDEIIPVYTMDMDSTKEKWKKTRKKTPFLKKWKRIKKKTRRGMDFQRTSRGKTGGRDVMPPPPSPNRYAAAHPSRTHPSVAFPHPAHRCDSTADAPGGKGLNA
jgi:hypothetical protein